MTTLKTLALLATMLVALPSLAQVGDSAAVAESVCRDQCAAKPAAERDGCQTKCVEETAAMLELSASLNAMKPKPPSFWDRYQTFIVTGLGFLVGTVGLIVVRRRSAAKWERARRDA